MLFAKKAKITKHSFLLLHEISFGFCMNHSNARVHMEHVDKMTTAILAIYNKKINPPISRELIHPDWIIDSAKALELGIVDEVIG
jgi:ATP-dependent protease ClpP protease subunit